MKTCTQHRIPRAVKFNILFFVGISGDSGDTVELQARGAQIPGARSLGRLNFM
jgi:hypothetical protein